jgi:RNA polymerase sigma-70 factor (ECF subfamily)
MATAQMGLFLRRLMRGMAAETLGEATDRQLLERWLAKQDEAVFEALVRRHGPMVYRACWRVLQQAEDTEDAFQVTFLVLARKLQTVRKRGSLASWLHGVAHRVALDAKARAGRARRHDQRDMRPAADPHPGPPEDITWRELRTVLDSELGRLPEKWRLPLILCYLEGRSQEEAATQLGWSKSTLLRRLEEARSALGRRLTRRGVVWPAALSAVLLSDSVTPAALAPGLVGSTAEAAARLAAGKAALTAVVSAKVAALIEGMLQTMFVTKLKLVAVALVLALGVGLAVSGWAMAQPKSPAPPSPPATPEKPATVEPQRAAAKDRPPPPERPKEEVIAPDLQKFPGTWVAMTDPYLDDKKMTEPPPAKGRAPMLKGRQFIFTETHCTDTNGAAFVKYVYKVDLNKTSKEIDLIPISSDGTQSAAPKLIKAIYAFDGDKLTLSWFPDERDRKRPTSFEKKPGAGQWFWYLERAKYAPLASLEKEPAFVGVKPTIETPDDDAEQKLVKARFNLMLETFRQRYEGFMSQPASVESLTRSARALLDARLELAATTEKQIEIRKEFLEFAKAIEGLCEIYAIPCKGELPRLSMEEYKFAQMARLDAEIDLVRAKRKAQPPATK